MPTADPPQDAVTSAVASMRRARPIYRVFVSSTWLDLQPERRALMDALNRMEEMRFVGMEFFGNRPDDTHSASIDQVDLCEVFVGIIGFRYGSGITEAEYRRARALNLPCFVYFKRGGAAAPGQADDDPALAAKLEAFKEDLLRGHTVKEFDRPEELAANATADLHNWVAARWISLDREHEAAVRPRVTPPDADRTNVLRLIERIDQDWIKGVLEASLHHRAWLELGLDWREDAVEHPWDRIVVAQNRPIQTLSREDSITRVFDSAQHTLLVLGEPGAGKTTTVLELARDLITRTRESAHEPAPTVLALSTWRGQHKDLLDWLVAELGLRYQVPKRVARTWLEEGRLVLILDGLDEVVPERRSACVDAINAFEQAHPPAGLAVTCRVAEYQALATKLRLRSAICLQPLTPEQIDRYFQAAGAPLAPLRSALREDAGLRELARSPLMLSVMTMAWRDAPAGTKAPFAAAQTSEELRHRLFDAYVHAALNRRGKASGPYTPEQTTRWLTWLARRMKEHGHTLFALEQLQPGWLEGTWRQFGYFVASRTLGTFTVALPFLFFGQPEGQIGAGLTVPVLGIGVGAYLGVIDYAFARHGWGGHRRAGTRLWATMLGLLFLTLGWLGLSPSEGALTATGMLYFIMVALAFCAPVDVRALDIKPAGSIQWSQRLAEARMLGCVGVLAIILFVIRLLAVQSAVGELGWAQGWFTLGGWHYVAGLAAGGALVLAAGPILRRWPRLQPTGLQGSKLLQAAGVLLGGQIGALVHSGVNGSESAHMANAMTLVAIFPTLLFFVFGGFGSTLIDPERPQQAGLWFWLRVPSVAFLMVGGVVFVPGLLLLVLAWTTSSGSNALAPFVALCLLASGCGLVAFLRFGGFNGAQHYLLRWLLARGGHLPAQPEAFLRHAAQLALLQKVGLGYRFVHALLLQHLAIVRGAVDTPAVAGAVAPGTGQVRAAPRASRGRQVVRVVAGLGLGVGLMLLAGLGAAGLALGRVPRMQPASAFLPTFIGVLMLIIALAIPTLLMAARWLGRCPGRWLAAGWLALGLGLAYLMTDEPASPRPPSLVEAPFSFPGAEQSDAVHTRFLLTRFGQERTFRWTGSNFNFHPEKPAAWAEILRDRRAEVETSWQKLEPVRAWLAELNSFARIADQSRDLGEVRVIDYMVMRPLIQTSVARAVQQALDGQGDAALATLQPLLEVGGKIEAGARGIRFWRNAREMQVAVIAAAAFVLDTAQVSAGSRNRFAAALQAGAAGAEGARRPYVIRYLRLEQASATFGRAMTDWGWQSLSFMEPHLDLLGPVVFNRQASLNRWGELFADLAELAARREPTKAQQRVDRFFDEEARVRFKNLGHGWVVCMSGLDLDLDEVAAEQRSYWLWEDRREALIRRLQETGR